MTKDKTHKQWHSDFGILFKRTAPKTCMAGFDCRPAIRCHSISVGRVLQRIAEEGRVIAVVPSTVAGESTLNLQGIGQVSTFSGFCAKHDQELFAPIDNFDYEPEDAEREFLFAYRTIARHHYYKLAWRYSQEAQLAAQKDVRVKGEKLRSLELKRQLTEEEVDQLVHFHERETTDAVSVSNALRDLMGSLNEAISRKNYDVIATRILMFPDEYPVAQSGSLILDSMTPKDRLHMITVNVIPQDGRTYALLSCTAGHGTLCIDGHLERFRVNGVVDYRAAVTHIICMAGDPLAISPSYWARLPEDLKSSFIRRLNVWMKGDVDPVQLDGLFNILRIESEQA